MKKITLIILLYTVFTPVHTCDIEQSKNCASHNPIMSSPSFKFLENLQSTVINFHLGSVAESAAKIVGIGMHDGLPVIITDKTPFHPLDATWPDQPGDKGELIFDTVPYKIKDSFTIVHHSQTNQTRVKSTDISHHNSEQGWIFLVGHQLQNQVDLDNFLGNAVNLVVDANYRYSLSLPHTTVHFMSLALNALMKPLLPKFKALQQDGLGNPDLTSHA